MRKKFCIFWLAFCLLLTACAPAAQPEADPIPEPDPAPAEEVSAPEEIPAPEEPELSERDRNWINDIHYLQSQYKMYHLDPFYFCPEEEFDQKIDQLCDKVADLSDNDIFFEMQTLIAGMGDLHTYFITPDSLWERLFPIYTTYVDGKMYLSHYLEGYEQFEPYVLREIVAVNGMDIGYIEDKFASFIDPYNAWRSQALTANYLSPAFFDWAGCGSQDGYTFQILDEDNRVQSVEVPTLSCEEYAALQWVYPANWTIHPAGNRTEYREGENGGYVYINLEQMDSLNNVPYQELFESAAELFNTHPACGKLAIDLRKNSGGRSYVINEYLSEGVQLLKELNIDQTYVLTGGHTMSAATQCISLFKEELNAVTVGEPTGQFFSFFAYYTKGAGQTLVLPQSQLTLYISSNWWDGDDPAWTAYDENGRLYAWESTIPPDIYIHQDIDDSRKGQDTVLNWVLAQ